MHLIAGLDISSLLKSRKKFEEFRKQLSRIKPAVSNLLNFVMN